MSFYAYAAEKLGKPAAHVPFWKVENDVARCFYDWLKESGADAWDEFAAAAEIEAVARRIAGRNNWRGD